MKLDHPSDVCFKHSAISFGAPDMPPPDVGRSMGPISLHNAIDDANERGDLALRQRVVLPLAGRADQVLKAVGPAVHLAAGDLDSPQILDDAHHGVETITRHRVPAPHELALLVVLSPVAKHGHDRIVHSFDLDHTARTKAPRAVLRAHHYRADDPEARIQSPHATQLKLLLATV